MNTKVMFSSMTDEWNTPKSLFNELDKKYKFDSDPCPSKVKLKKGLFKGFGRKVFVNPPYSNIKEWAKICYLHSKLTNSLVVMLIPSRTDTKWFHNYIMKANEIKFIKGRLYFSNHKNPAPFPSCIVIFK